MWRRSGSQIDEANICLSFFRGTLPSDKKSSYVLLHSGRMSRATMMVSKRRRSWYGFEADAVDMEVRDSQLDQWERNRTRGAADPFPGESLKSVSGRGSQQTWCLCCCFNVCRAGKRAENALWQY